MKHAGRSELPNVQQPCDKHEEAHDHRNCRGVHGGVRKPFDVLFVESARLAAYAAAWVDEKCEVSGGSVVSLLLCRMVDTQRVMDVGTGISYARRAENQTDGMLRFEVPVARKTVAHKRQTLEAALNRCENDVTPAPWDELLDVILAVVAN